MGDEEGFEPDDLNELEKTFAKIYKDSEVGYTVELHLSKLAAKEMVDEWLNALMGDKNSIRQCMINYSYMMEEIIAQIHDDEL